MSNFRPRGTWPRTITIPFPKSSTGKVLQRCPVSECSPRDFRIASPPDASDVDEALLQKIRRRPGTKGTTCPYCGHDADDQMFVHPSDAQYVERRKKWETERVAQELLADVASHFDGIFKDMARGSRGMIKVTGRSHRPAPQSPSPLLPPREDLLRNVACHVCSRGYGVYALALFCPDCGAANLTTHMLAEVGLAEAELEQADALQTEGNREHAERKIGNVCEDVASAAETYLKAIYAFVTRRRLTELEAEKLLAKVFNDFQNSQRATDRFRPYSFDPFACLEKRDAELFDRMMSKRHVVTHNLGVVDAHYVRRTGEGVQGQNLALSPDEVRQFMVIVERIIGYCENTLPEFLPAAT